MGLAWTIVAAALAVVVAGALALAALVFVFPDRIPDSLSGWLPRVDLQTGPRFVLELDVVDLRRHRLAGLREDVRGGLREGRIAGGSLVAGDVVEVRLREGVDRAQAIAKLNELLQPAGQPTLEIVAGEGGVIRIGPTAAAAAEQVRAAVKDAVAIIDRRLTELAKAKPSVRPEGSARIVVRVPPSVDAKAMIEVATRPGRLEFRLIDTSMTPEAAASGTPPAESEVLYDADRLPYLVEKRVLMMGQNVTDAQPAFDQRTGEPVVTFRFDAAGTRRFAEITRDNVGRPFAVVLDAIVRAAPIIREPIVGGSGQISGQFTPEQANEIAILLRAGQLPARITVVKE